jgi:hypothetical protein
MKKITVFGLLVVMHLNGAESDMNSSASGQGQIQPVLVAVQPPRRTRTASIEAPQSPGEALRLAKARAQAEKELGQPITSYKEELTGATEEVADKCGRNWCCICGCVAGIFIVLCNGCCYKPKLRQVERARKALQPKSMEIKT